MTTTSAKHPREALLAIRKVVAKSPRAVPWTILWKMCLPKEIDESVRKFLDTAFAKVAPDHVGPMKQRQRLAVLDEALAAYNQAFPETPEEKR